MRTEYEMQLVAGSNPTPATGKQLNQIRGYIGHVASLETRLDASIEMARNAVVRARESFLKVVATRDKFAKLHDRQVSLEEKIITQTDRLESDATGIARFNRIQTMRRD